MVNSTEFTKRLESILNYYDISAAGFADKIDVGRSSISHLLSGRNKPSLDFVLKVIKNFPEVELYWLLNGKGSFPASTPKTEIPKKEVVENTSALPKEKIATPIPDFTNQEKKEIKKIVIFYKDGTFDAFEN